MWGRLRGRKSTQQRQHLRGKEEKGLIEAIPANNLYIGNIPK